MKAISVILSAVDKVTAPLKSISNSVSNFQKKFDQNSKMIKESWDVIGNRMKWAGIVAGATAGSMFALAKTTASYGDNLNDTAQYLGMSTQSLQEFQYVASLTGLSTEEMNTALSKLTINLGKGADSGGEIAETIAKLGLNVNQLAAIGPEQAMMKIADAMQKIPNATERARISVALFGRSGIKMGNVLSQGSKAIAELRQEAHSLGVVMSDDAIKASAEFDDSWQRLMITMTGVRNTLGGLIMPAINKAMQGVTDWVSKNQGLVQSIAKVAVVVIPLVGALLSLAITLSTIGYSFKLIKGGLSILGAGFKIFGSLIFKAGGLIISVVRAITMAMISNPIIAIIAGIAIAATLIIMNWSKIAPFFANLWKSITGFFVGAWNAIVGAFQSAWDYIWGLLDSPILQVLLSIFAPFVGLPVMIIKNWSTITGFFSNLWSNITGIFNSAISSIVGLIPEPIKNLLGIGGGAATLNVNNSPTGEPARNASQIQQYYSSKTEKQEVTVKFDNMPRGTKVDNSKARGGVDLTMGYANASI